jgi:hypothetical protein
VGVAILETVEMHQLSSQQNGYLDRPKKRLIIFSKEICNPRMLRNSGQYLACHLNSMVTKRAGSLPTFVTECVNPPRIHLMSPAF